jgi:3-oxoacyl-[acyl-carrier protein] reductase
VGRLDVDAGLHTAVAVITGGGSGIGAAVAERFLAEGARVAIWDLTQSQPVAGTLFVEADVTDEHSAQAAVEHVTAEYGPIDILVNCAGVVGPHGSVETIPVAEWRRTLEVNLTGTFIAIRSVLGGMIARGRGAVVNFVSGSATDYSGGTAAYNASKMGVINLTKTIAVDIHSTGVRINAICPGMVATPLTRSYIDSDLIGDDEAARAHQQEVREAFEQGMMSEPSEVVDLVVYLVSKQGSRVNGQFIRSSMKGYPSVQQ